MMELVLGELLEIPYYIILLIIFIMISIITRLVLKRHKSNIPPNTILLGLAVVFGGAIASVPYLHKTWVGFASSPQRATDAYLPMFIMSTMINMDHNAFKKYLRQSILVTLSSALFSPAIISVFMTFVLYDNWSYRDSFTLSLIILPLEPRYVLEQFQGLSHNKFMATMLESEAVMVLAPTFLGMTVLAGYHTGVTTEFFQIVCVVIRDIVGGIFTGHLFGILHVRVLMLLSNDPVLIACASILVAYATLFVSNYLVYVNGPLAIACLGGYLIMHRHMLTPEVENALQVFWMTLFNLMEPPMMMCAMTEVTLYAALLFEYRTVYSAIFLYLMGILERLRACLMLWPLLNRMSYNVNSKCLLILGWSGIRGTLNMYLLLTVVGWHHLKGTMQSYLLAAIFYVFLSNFINCITMRLFLNLMGLMSESSIRVLNMQHCMSFLRHKQLCMMDILKHNRYLANVNWPLIRRESFVYASYLEKVAILMKSSEFPLDGNYGLNDSVLTCPDCHKQFRNEPSAKEVESILKETRLQVLKSQKVAMIRLNQSGLIDKKILQYLVHFVDTKIESQRVADATINLHKNEEQSSFYPRIVKMLLFIADNRHRRSPKSKIRRLCYYFVLHYLYEIILFAVTLINALFSMGCPVWLYWYHFAFTAIYVLDYLLKIEAFWGITFVDFNCKTLIRKEKWLIYDGVILALRIVNLCIIDRTNYTNWSIYYIPSFKTLSAIHLTIVLRLLAICAPRIITYINYKHDRNIARRFILVHAWSRGIEELLGSLPHIVPERIAKEYYVKALKEERERLLNEMISVQKERPWVAITVKTRQAVQVTLYALDIALMDMLRAGYIDAIELDVIMKLLSEPLKYMQNMNFVTPNTVADSFRHIPWMPHDMEEVMEYLCRNAEEASRDARENVMEIGTVAKGVYVVVTGMLVLAYNPQDMARVSNDAYMPIIDYLTTTDYNTPYEETVVSGSTVGELSVITGRPYNCNIHARSPSQGYWLPSWAIHTAMRMASHPITGMEAQIWLNSCRNLAVVTIMQAPEYRSCTKDEIRNKLKHAFMPNLRPYQSFIYLERIELLLLINGMVRDPDSGELFRPPRLIPDNVDIIEFVDTTAPHLDVKMLIVPREDTTALEIMHREEMLAELRPKANSKDLLLTKMERKMTKLDKNMLPKPSEINI